jgi:hypothetical protein
VTDRDIYNDLRGDVCLCDAHKTPGKSFCRAHYFALPTSMRNALYERDGYPETFRATARHLSLPLRAVAQASQPIQESVQS